MSADSTLRYPVIGYDSLGYETDPGSITWGLAAAVGTINASGLFDATMVGTAKVVAVSDLCGVST